MSWLLFIGLVLPVAVVWFLLCVEFQQRVVEPWLYRRMQRNLAALSPKVDDWPMPEPREPNCPDYPEPDDAAPWRAYCRAYSPRSLIGEGHPRIRPGNEDTP